jgi:hypothetical protein
MITINRQEEYDLLVSGEKVIHLGIIGGPANRLHDGHLWLQSECKRIHPDFQLLLKIFTPIRKIQNIVLQNSLHDLSDLEYDLNAIETWAQVDYLLETSWSDFSQYGPDLMKMGMATFLPTYNISYANWNTWLTQAEDIMKEQELDIYPDLYSVTLVKHCLLAAISGNLDYQYKCSGKKDGWLNHAKKFIYENYSGYNVEYLLIDTLKDAKGTPVGSPASAFVEIEADWYTKQGTTIYTPKWLNGKSFVEKEIDLENGNQIRISEVV